MSQPPLMTQVSALEKRIDALAHQFHIDYVTGGSILDRLSNVNECLDQILLVVGGGSSETHTAEQIQDQLEKFMKNRPTRDELVQRNYMPDYHVSPALLERQHQLQRAQVEDRLEKQLGRRPDATELEQRHILKNTKISPNLLQQQEALRRRQLEDRLERKLEHRPTSQELEHRHVFYSAEDEKQRITQAKESVASFLEKSAKKSDTEQEEEQTA